VAVETYALPWFPGFTSCLTATGKATRGRTAMRHSSEHGQKAVEEAGTKEGTGSGYGRFGAPAFLAETATGALRQRRTGRRAHEAIEPVWRSCPQTTVGRLREITLPGRVARTASRARGGRIVAYGRLGEAAIRGMAEKIAFVLDVHIRLAEAT